MPPTNEPMDVFKHYDMTGQTTECWVWKGAWGGRENGKRPYFMCDGNRTMAYRIVYSLTHGVVLTQSQSLLHSCDNGAWPIGCGNPAHLRIGTTKENADDRVLRQRHGLSHTIVRSIRRGLANGRTQQELADLFEISRESISAIATGRTYAQVSDEDEAETSKGAESATVDKELG